MTEPDNGERTGVQLATPRHIPAQPTSGIKLARVDPRAQVFARPMLGVRLTQRPNGSEYPVLSRLCYSVKPSAAQLHGPF